MRYLNLTRRAGLPDVSMHAPFKAVVVVEVATSDERRDEICRWLVEMGCRYLVACGSGCEPWPDAVRAANLSVFDAEYLGAPDFVMTTSHPYESPRSVLWYAKHAARHPEVAFAELLVLDLALADRSAEFEVVYQKA